MIASSTRGFATPQADTPPVISPYARPLQDQDEKGSLSGSLALSPGAPARRPPVCDPRSAIGNLTSPKRCRVTASLDQGGACGAASGAPRAGLWPWRGPARRARAVPSPSSAPDLSRLIRHAFGAAGAAVFLGVPVSRSWPPRQGRLRRRTRSPRDPGPGDHSPGIPRLRRKRGESRPTQGTRAIRAPCRTWASAMWPSRSIVIAAAGVPKEAGPRRWACAAPGCLAGGPRGRGACRRRRRCRAVG